MDKLNYDHHPTKCYFCKFPLKELIENVKYSIDGKTFEAPEKYYHCEKCNNSDADIVMSTDMGIWEKKIAQHIIDTVMEPTANMYSFVRRVYGLTIPNLKWLVKNSSKI